MPALWLLLIASDPAQLIDLGGSETAFCERFNEGKASVRFVAIVSPG